MSQSLPDFTGALVFTGGGTGGHYFPAVALAEGARARWPQLPIAFVGAQRGIEALQLPNSPWPHLLLDVEGLVGRSPRALLVSLYKLLRAKRRLKILWQRSRPLAVIATGGYGAAPAVLAARSLGIPYFLHESNAHPGQLVAKLAPGAQRVWCGMGQVADKLPKARCLVVGTPVRAGFMRPFAPLASLAPPFQLLALGGSGGAQALSEALFDVMPSLLEQFPHWTLLHQTGRKHWDALKDRPRHPRHDLTAFVDQMDQVLEGTSIVISRSGASACAELKACGRPAVLVPMPGSAGDHQRMNALAMVEEHRGLMVEQGQGFAPRLAQALAGVMGDAPTRLALSHPVANAAVAQCLDDFARLVKWQSELCGIT